jgi:hypothetical protein
MDLAGVVVAAAVVAAVALAVGVRPRATNT